MLIKDLIVTGICKLIQNASVRELVVEAINEVTKEELDSLKGVTENIAEQISSVNTNLQTAETLQTAFKTEITDDINNIPRNPSSKLNVNSTLAEIATNLKRLEYGPDVSMVTAISNRVVNGYQFVDKDWNVVTGNVPDNTSNHDTSNYSCGYYTESDSYKYYYMRIPYGYYGAVLEDTGGSANEVRVERSVFESKISLTADKVKYGETVGFVEGTYTNDGTIDASKVLKDYVGYSKGTRVVGTIPTRIDNYWSGYESVGLQPLPSGQDDYQLQVFFPMDTDWGGDNSGYYTKGSIVRSNIYLPLHKVAYGTRIGRGPFNDPDDTNSVVGTFTEDAEIQDELVLEGKVYYAKGQRRIGTMPIYNYNCGIGELEVLELYLDDTNTNLIVRMPVGYYDETIGGAHEMTIGAGLLLSAIDLADYQIVKGNTILGLQGTGVYNTKLISLPFSSPIKVSELHCSSYTSFTAEFRSDVYNTLYTNSKYFSRYLLTILTTSDSPSFLSLTNMDIDKFDGSTEMRHGLSLILRYKPYDDIGAFVPEYGTEGDYCEGVLFAADTIANGVLALISVLITSTDSYLEISAKNTEISLDAFHYIIYGIV